MKTIHTHARHVEWLSAEEMHIESKKWLSELEFLKDEQLFFDDLIKSYTLQLIDNNHFEDSKKLVEELSHVVKRTQLLIEAVKTHENELQIMVDGINQIKEESIYKKEHRNLIEIIGEFKKTYNKLKIKLFSLIKTVMKEGKQKRLLE